MTLTLVISFFWSLKFLVIFERAEAVHMSGISEKAYIRSSNAGQLFDELPVYAYHPCFADRCVKFLPLIIKVKFARVG